MPTSTPDEADDGSAGADGSEAADGSDAGVSVNRYLTASLLVLLVGAVVSVTGVGGPSLSGPLFVPDWKFGALAAVVMVVGIARAELAG
jgi:hypothetical protein